MERPNFYDQSGLDRMSERRSDEKWIRALLETSETRIMPVWRAKNLVETGAEPRAAHLAVEDAKALSGAGGELVFLGVKQGIAHFSVDLSHIDDPASVPELAGRGEFVELRSVGALLSRDEGSILAYARALAHWHRHHRFCGTCGAATEMRESGHLRVCTDAGCATHHFPRTDPAVIMLVSRGDNALLGRKREWVEGMYSALAGFVEPGESLEGAVAREVMEETGVVVSNVRYQSSQPWPFPASLMLGFHADTENTEINFNPDELEDARWFTRAELRDGAAGLARRRRSDSIARRLITDWIAQA
jgi:NAD+ diphosphatase